MADNDDDFHDRVLGMADDLGLSGDERRKYVHNHMTKKGYKMEPTYVKAEDDDDDGDDGDAFFGSSRSRRRPRSDDGEDERGRSRSRNRRGGGGSDNWYS